MKRYKYTWFNGMIEVPNGEYVKEKEASEILQHWLDRNKLLNEYIESQQHNWQELHTKYSDKKIYCLLLTAGLLFSVFFNIFQFLIT